MSERPTKYCFRCGAVIDLDAEICPKCGVRQPVRGRSATTERKSPGIAAVLAFFVPGLGHIYCGQIGKGIIFLLLAIVSVVLIFFIIGIPMYIIVWIINIIDAHRTAIRINKGLIQPEE
ncbi:MAG: TM2 domain-containing protein [Nitrososphaerota archaeon]